MPMTNLVGIGQIVLLLLLPPMLVGAAVHAPRLLRTVRRRVAERRAARDPRPPGPPIERIAADLRRLLRQHDAVVGSSDLAMRARRLWALEAAITDCAAQAAAALGVPCPPRPVHGGLDKPQLRRLLAALAAAGLALPTTGLLAPDSRP
jgi:hypothetical protein